MLFEIIATILVGASIVGSVAILMLIKNDNENLKTSS